jgi:transposase
MDKTDTMNIHPQLMHACGIDVHKDKVSVCFYISKELEEVKDYGTFTEDLHKIRDAMLAHQIKDAIMESTGVYWIALYCVLTQAGIRVRVVNAKFVKNMPKEKTDKKDAKWLCKLLVNMMVRASFVVNEQQRSFRDLCRMRMKYSHNITQSHNRILKNLERRNIKLRSVASNMDTKVVANIVNALANGEEDVEKLVSFCKGKMKKKKDQMRKALQGVITSHDRMMLRQLLDDLAHYRKQIAALEQEIAKHTAQMNPELIAALQEVKGIGPVSTEIILAEVGDNVSAFESCEKLAAWVGLAPGQNDSADKKKTVRTREGNKHIRTTMLQVAWAAVRTKNSYWRALYYHLCKRMIRKKAIVVIARKLIRIIYKIINGQMKQYQEYGDQYFIQRMQERLAQKRNHNITLKQA